MSKHSPWSYIADELSARGWSREDLAREMGGDAEENLCGLAFMETCQDIQITIGTFAEGLARAFGTSAELWANIDEQYRAEQSAPPEEPAP